MASVGKRLTALVPARIKAYGHLMRAPASALALACSLFGCAPAAPPSNAIASELAGRIAGPAQSCVSSSPAENIRPLDRTTVAYGSGRTIYVNRLRAACPGITPTSTLIIEAQGTQYCRGDRIRGREPGAIIPGPICVLGEWVPYTLPR